MAVVLLCCIAGQKYIVFHGMGRLHKRREILEYDAMCNCSLKIVMVCSFNGDFLG